MVWTLVGNIRGPAGMPGVDGQDAVSAVRWAGIWSPEQAYETGDIVGYQGSSYIALVQTQGEPPAEVPATWELVAKHGDRGPQGFRGLPGVPGKDGKDGKDGDRGAEGADGAAVLSGHGKPSTDLGADGDQFIDVDTGDVWKRQDGAWAKIGNICGPAGPRGPRGATGERGLPGAVTVLGGGGGGGGSGTQGPKGDKGDTGDPGLAATVDVGTTTTGAPGTDAAVTNSGTSSAAILDFIVPAGADGAPGPPGDPGATNYTTPAIVLGTAAVEGVADSVIRSDATIVAFDATAPTTAAFGDAAATGSAAVAAHRDHQHGMPANPVPAFGSPSASAVGDTASDGVATTLPRSDHRHAREAFGTPGSSAVGDGAAAGSAATVAHSDHVHGREAFAAPAASAVADAGTTGTATTLVHSDHKHAREGFGSPSTQAFGDAATDGTATTVPHSDHKHAMPTNPVSYATPSIALGSSAAAGAAATLIRSDSTIAAFDATAPVTQAFGDAAAVGTAAFAARRDHKHGMPTIALANLPTVPIVRVRRTVDQSIGNATQTAIVFDTANAAEDIDTDTMHDLTTTPSRITIQTAGTYLFLGAVAWVSNSTGRRHANLFLNGTTVLSFDECVPLATGNPVNFVAALRTCIVNDYVELRAYQDITGGGSLAVNSGSNGVTLQALRVAA